jgi:hypothetical protein
MERSGDWAAALRLWLQRTDARLIEARTLDECWRRLVQHPTAMAALELTADNVRPLLAVLLRIEDELPEVRAIVLAERKLAGYENLVREAGAVRFTTSPRLLADVAELIRRRTMTLAASAARLADEFADPRPAIFANLPWSEIS